MALERLEVRMQNSNEFLLLARSGSSRNLCNLFMVYVVCRNIAPFHQDVHSFPTRRSSDLSRIKRRGVGGCACWTVSSLMKKRRRGVGTCRCAAEISSLMSSVLAFALPDESEPSTTPPRCPTSRSFWPRHSMRRGRNLH